MGVKTPRRPRRERAPVRLTTGPNTASLRPTHPTQSSKSDLAHAELSPEDLRAVGDALLVHSISVEERLRVCFTLIGAIYQVNELAGEHGIVQVEGFAPEDIARQVPVLTRALREQLLAVRRALPFECLHREAPLGTPREGSRER